VFLAPYSQLEAKKITDPAEAYITGPTIYDHTGVRIAHTLAEPFFDKALATNMDWIYHVSRTRCVRLQERDVQRRGYALIHHLTE
jgi:hypothetical protein